MTDKKGSIVEVQRERRIEGDPTTYSQIVEVKRAEHSGLNTIHATTTAGVVTSVLVVPAGYMAFITKLNWEWQDGDGPHYLIAGIGGPTSFPLYWQGIINQMVPDDPPGLDWGDGSHPVVFATEGTLQADCLACLVDSELTITYYLEKAM